MLRYVKWAPHCGLYCCWDWWGSWMEAHLLGWPQLHLQLCLLSLGCPDLLQWWRWICWLSAGGLFLGVVHLCPVLSLWQAAALEASTECLCWWGGPHLQNTVCPLQLSSQTSFFCPNHKENSHLLPAGLETPFTSQPLILWQSAAGLFLVSCHCCKWPIALGFSWRKWLQKSLSVSFLCSDMRFWFGRSRDQHS